MKKTLKTLVLIIGIPALLFVWFLIYFTLTEYRPKKIIVISEHDQTAKLTDTIFSILTWNIGYAGLGSNMDFFYDGGEKTRDTKSNTNFNLKKIGEFLRSNDTMDFIFLQEVDRDVHSQST